jgi:hypothetical protein
MTFYFILKLGYIHCTGGSIVAIPNRLILYIATSPPLSLPLNPFPTPLKAVARGFFVLFHVGI